MKNGKTMYKLYLSIKVEVGSGQPFQHMWKITGLLSCLLYSIVQYSSLIYKYVSSLTKGSNNSPLNIWNLIVNLLHLDVSTFCCIVRKLDKIVYSSFFFSHKFKPNLVLFILCISLFYWCPVLIIQEVWLISLNEWFYICIW